MRIGSLFSGIGGLELGLEAAGMETVWQVERDAYACRVLEKHWPNVQRYHDVRTFRAIDAPAVDLICGGFPCQPHSLAGKRQASADERDLWGEFERIIREAKPRWIVAENVPGLLSSEAGRYFGRVLGGLAALGYDAEWFVLPASAVGAPHRRERVFIVAHATGSRFKREWDTEKQIQAQSFVNSAGKHVNVAHAESHRWKRCYETERMHTAPNDHRWSKPIRSHAGIIKGNEWWAVEPGMGRVANGVPSRVDRLRCLGNAVVPQVAYFIGTQIMKFDRR